MPILSRAGEQLRRKMPNVSITIASIYTSDEIKVRGEIPQVG
jgi:hypothetical protein